MFEDLGDLQMATPICPEDKPSDYDPEKPNHIIFWLDVTIGKPNEYKHLKQAFGSNTDPRCETWTMLNDGDYINMIADNIAVPVTFGGVQFLLYAFDNEKDCLNAFEKHQDKRIFFITSGSLGQSIIPKVIEQYRHVFTDRITDKAYSSIYIFCHNIELHMHWVMDYVDYVQMFNFDSEVLERMTRDIADYFVERGKRLRQDNDLEGALQRLYWAKRLWYQYQKMQRQSSISASTNSSTTTPTDRDQPIMETKETKEIEQLIEEIEQEQREKPSDDENENNDDDENKCYQSSN